MQPGRAKSDRSVLIQEVLGERGADGDRVLLDRLYADASHPLTEGYALLAERIASDVEFKKWLGEK